MHYNASKGGVDKSFSNDDKSQIVWRYAQSEGISADLLGITVFERKHKLQVEFRVSPRV